MKLEGFDFQKLLIRLEYDDVIKIATALDENPKLIDNEVAYNFRNQLWTYLGIVDEAKILKGEKK